MISIKYSMCDLICDVITCCVWSCDLGIINARGGDLGATGGIVPFKYLGGGDGGAFIPPMFRKCHCKLSL